MVSKILVIFCEKFDEIWRIFDEMLWKFVENLGKFFAQFLWNFLKWNISIKILEVKLLVFKKIFGNFE